MQILQSVKEENKKDAFDILAHYSFRPYVHNQFIFTCLPLSDWKDNLNFQYCLNPRMWFETQRILERCTKWNQKVK